MQISWHVKKFLFSSLVAVMCYANKDVIFASPVYLTLTLPFSKIYTGHKFHFKVCQMLIDVRSQEELKAL